MNARRPLSALVLPVLVSCAAPAPNGGADAGVGGAGANLADLRREFRVAHRPVVVEGDAERLVVEATGIRVVPRLRPHDSAAPARVSLPLRADGDFRVETDGASIAVRLRAAQPSAAEVADDAVVYRNAFAGGTLVHVPTQAGTEEFLHFAERSSTVARYDVSLRGIAGLRRLGGVVEFLDGSGNPLFRTSAPVVVDTAGRTREGTLRIEGCAFDTDPRPPWGRAVTPAGADECTVVSEWSDEGLTYPLVVDPAWTKTTVLGKPRADLSASVVQRADVAACTAGCVLVTGGDGFPAQAPELFNAATKTWAAAAALPVNTWLHGQAALPSGRFIVVGGWVSPSATTTSTQSAIFDPKTGAWTAVSSNTLAGPVGVAALPLATTDATGKVTATLGLVMAIGYDKYSVFNESTGVWSAQAALPRPRADVAIGAFTTPCTVSCAQDGYVYLAGGKSSNAVDVWRAYTGTWASAGNLSVPRGRLTVVDAGDRMLFAGGHNDADGSDPLDVDFALKTAPSTVAKSAVSLTTPHQRGLGATAKTAGGLQPLVIGGDINADTADVLLADTSASTKLDYARTSAAAVTLPSGSVMVIGGRIGGSYPGNEEIYLPGSNGATCTTAGDCASLHCVDGVCCEDACTGNCAACNVSGSAGKCVAIKGAPTGGRPACAGAGTVCGSTCDGIDKSACKFASTTTECVASTCSSGTETPAALCNGSGECNPSPASISCGAYGCGATACKTTCATDGDCASGYTCNASTCVPAASTCSDDLQSSIPADKTAPKPCAPFSCDRVAGNCYTSCSTTEQCAKGSVCDGAKCVPAAAPEEDSGGCAVARSPGDGGTLCVLSVAVALGLISRRGSRDRRGPRPSPRP